MSYLFTSESVSEGHPDKVSDQISDALLDEFLAFDPQSKVACETLVTTGQVVLAGEVRTSTYIDVQKVASMSDDELEQIGVEARGLLLKLEQCGVLDTLSREMVITQLMALGADTIELEHVKWVILMVLSNYTDGEGVSELTETVVLDGLHSCIH